MTVIHPVHPAQWSTATQAALEAAGLDQDMVAAVISRSLTEDLADGPDVTTSATVNPDVVAQAAITPRRSGGVLAGGPVAVAVFDTILGAGRFTAQQQPDGSELVAGKPAIIVRGNVSGILTAERTALLRAVPTATSTDGMNSSQAVVTAP